MTLETTYTDSQQQQHVIVTVRNAGESDNDFVDRHLADVLAFVIEHP